LQAADRKFDNMLELLVSVSANINAETIGDRNRIIDIIKNGSVVTWQHINMQGEYNFSDDYLKDAFARLFYPE
jgi:hypothetical protein